MKTALRARIRFMDSLAFRVALLLSIALLPIGVMSLMQFSRTAAQASRVAQAALVGRTGEAAAAERGLMRTAFGAAQALAEIVPAKPEEAAACSALLTDVVRQSGQLVYAGFTSADGIQRCFTRGEQRDVSDTGHFKRMAEFKEPQVSATNTGLQTGESVVTIRWPAIRDGEFLGYVVMSIPQQRIQTLRRFGDIPEALDIVTFNAQGEVLTSGVTANGTSPEALIPQSRTLAELASEQKLTFEDQNREGQPRIFTVVSVIPGQVYALGSWSPEAITIPGGFFPAAFYPLLMWLASVAVAYYAVNHLVIRHIRTMRGQMRRFALGQRAEPPEVLTDAPAEIQDVSQTFHNLARILIRDEAELEASVEEKTVLLKEVHHRVKNNLQLISSIMNMQIRRVKEPAARRVLKSVQDRVMSLATIHRSLYTAERLSAVPVDQLLGDIANQMVVLTGEPGQNINVQTDFAPITLYPDQAVPLALIATESVTNAMKYLGRPAGGGRAWIKATLRRSPEGIVEYVCENSSGTPVWPSDPAEGASTGLGLQLIQAFTAQLEATHEVEQLEDRYRVRLTFRELSEITEE